MGRPRSEHILGYAFIASMLAVFINNTGVLPKDWYGFTTFTAWSLGAMYGLYKARDKNTNQEIHEVEAQPQAGKVEIEKEINAAVYEEFQFFKDKPKQQ
ncbi:hypothetical protein [Burkholderia cenocepacia]|uniref:hypothetical protein n=1 Tax=Burkholderia cenocepacia TaxID=95486 RepID=UPI002237CC4F|nr:hypothetical protein [Burkholderia cenocepacia]MCW5156364.1 hypothetical protein [Burkholderia cenocepacia]